jgi:uncharacterized protein (TIGR04255 family)
MSHRYSRPPIVEAMIELRFQSVTGRVAVLEVLRGALESFDDKVQHEYEVSVDLGALHDEGYVQPAPGIAKSVIRSKDRRWAVGVREDGVSVHTLVGDDRPYVGWLAVCEKLDAVLAALPAETKAAALASVGLRYIDRFVVPENKPFHEYVTLVAPRPGSLPQIGGETFVRSTIPREDGIVVELTFAGPIPGQNAAILDVTVLTTAVAGQSLDGDWRIALQRIHDLEGEVFEAAITEQARRSFQ